MGRRKPRRPKRRFAGIQVVWSESRWCWRWRAFRYVDGRKSVGKVRDTQEEAAADRAELDAGQGAFRRAQGITLGAALDQVLAAARRRGVAERTVRDDYASRGRVLERFLGPQTPLAALADVDTILGEFVQPARTAGRAAGTIKRDLWILGQAFAVAGLPNLTHDAMKEARGTLKAVPARTEWISAPKLRAVLAAIRARSIEDADLLEIVAVTGVRAGEFGRVRVCDVEIEPPRIHVREPKDRGNPRICEIPRQSVPALERLVERAASRDDGGRVDQRVLVEDSEETLGTVCSRWRQRLQLRHRFNARVLRHSFNMAAIEVGGGRLTDVMGLAGHKKATTTERYLHEQGERRQEIVGRIGDALIGGEDEEPDPEDHDGDAKKAS